MHQTKKTYNPSPDMENTMLAQVTDVHRKRISMSEFGYNKKLIFLFLLFVSNQLFAAFEIKQYTINSGGSKSASNRYQLNSSIAQVDAGKKLQSAKFELYSGFWSITRKQIPLGNFIFRNGFE